MRDAKGRAPITPATKVAELLESWPELEEALVAQAPAFRRLRNPVLRRTVARVATLEQAAGVGGVSARELVSALRRAAGLDADGGDCAAQGPAGVAPRPAWVDDARVVETIDAEALLDAGQVPLARVNERARALRDGEALRLLSTFRPLPLVDALARQGCACFTVERSPGSYETIVGAARGGSPAGRMP